MEAESLLAFPRLSTGMHCASALAERGRNCLSRLALPLCVRLRGMGRGEGGRVHVLVLRNRKGTTVPSVF